MSLSSYSQKKFSIYKRSKLQPREVGNQPTTSKDPLEVLIGSITGLKSKKIKEAFNGFIQDIWAKSNFQNSIRNNQALINIIYANLTKLN